MGEIKALDQEYIVESYARMDVQLIRGTGAECYDINNNRYLDLTSGIGVNSLGFCDPQWVKAVTNQAATLQHTSNYFYTGPSALLAKKLAELTGCSKVFFANSGAESNECAIKIARKYGFDRYGKKRTNIVCLTNSFHGRTVTTLSATGQEVMHNYFFPFTEGFSFVPANDIHALQQAMNDRVCAVMLELVQGEGGVIPMEQTYVTQVMQLCRQRNILLIVDEVQTGVGRTGTFLASEQFGISPDITTLAKGLGGGLPIGAVLCGEKVSETLKPGDHGSTFGGNPVACAGATVCVETIAAPDFLEQVQQKGQLIREKLQPLDEVVQVDGLGLMLGITLKTKNVRQLIEDCAKHGLLVLSAKQKLRLLPPLNLTDKQLSEALDILTQLLTA